VYFAAALELLDAGCQDVVAVLEGRRQAAGLAALEEYAEGEGEGEGVEEKAETQVEGEAWGWRARRVEVKVEC
jgi:hypothetical protein